MVLKIAFGLGGLLLAILTVYILIGLFVHYRKKSVNKSVHWFSLISFTYALLAFFSLVWAFSVLSYAPFDFVILYAFALVVQTILLLMVFTQFERSNTLFRLLIAYSIPFLFVWFSLFAFILGFIFISGILTLFILGRFLNYSGVYRTVSYIGVAYASLIILFTFFVFFGVGDPYLLAFPGMILFGVFAYYFMRDVGQFSIHTTQKKETTDSQLSLFVRYFVYLIVMLNLVFFTTIGVHELGHVLSARYHGCDSRAVVYEEGSYPYSEIFCDTLDSQTNIALAGPILPLVAALILLLIGGSLIRPVAVLIMGFNLLASYQDLLELGLSPNLVIAATFIGCVLLIVGVYMLIRSRFQETL